VTLQDLLNDVLSVINYSTSNLDNLVQDREEIFGVIDSQEPPIIVFLPLQKTSFRGNIVSELNNTLVLQFDKININDIMSRVGIFITGSESGIEVTARILGYYTKLDSKLFLASSWQLYVALNEVE